MDRCCCRCCGLEACKLKGSNVKVSCSKSHCALRHQAYITSFRGGQFCVLVWNHRLQSVSGAKAYACVTVFRKVQLKGTLQPDSACIGKRFIKQGVKPVVRRWLRNIEKRFICFTTRLIPDRVLSRAVVTSVARTSANAPSCHRVQRIRLTC